MPGNYNQFMSGFSMQSMGNSNQNGINANKSQMDAKINNPFYVKESKENILVNSLGQNNMNINQINMNIMNQNNMNQNNMVQNSLNNSQNNMNQSIFNNNMNNMNQSNFNNNRNNMNQNNMNMSQNNNANINGMKNTMNMNQNNMNMMNQNNMNIMNKSGLNNVNNMNNMNNNNMMGMNSFSINQGIGMGLNLSNKNSQMQVKNNTFSKNMNPNLMNMNNMNLNNMNNNNMNNNNFNNGNNDMNNMNIFTNMSNNSNKNNFNQINTNLVNPNNINNMNNANMNNNNNQNNNNDQNILNDICDTHVFKLSKNYDYKPSEATVHLNNLLKDMDNFGEITKKKIEQEKASNPTKFISLQDALFFNNNQNQNIQIGLNNMFNNNNVNNPQRDYFVCGLLKLALESQGCTCEIERVDDVNNLSQNEIKEAYTAIQFITNGMYKYKKYILYFDLGEEKNTAMMNDLILQNDFNTRLQNALKSLFKITIKDIIMANPRKSPYIITAIIKISNFNELPENQLYDSLKTDYGFDTIIKVEKSILLNGCKLNRIMLDCRGDRNVGWGINEMRGGKPYSPPMGWMGYGIRVLGRFDGGDDTWLDFKNNPGEWAVAYHGMGSSSSGEININNDLFNTVIRQKFKKSNDKYNEGKTVGEGVYMTPLPNIMESFCKVYNYQGKKYKIGIMCRVKPDKIRCPADGDDFWIINGTDNEVRPYRILIKEIM